MGKVYAMTKSDRLALHEVADIFRDAAYVLRALAALLPEEKA